MLEVKNLTVSVKRGNNIFTAVDGINFSLNAGEMVTLAGESGCGKTLTALSIKHLLPSAARISGGEIIYQNSVKNSVNLSFLDEKSLCKIRGNQIAMIFQEPRQSLNPLMKIGDQIAEPLRLRGVNKTTAGTEVLELLRKLKFAEPEKIFNARPFQLSGGMCRRVMIAAGVICRPRLLIADEPTASLDPETRTLIANLLKQINTEFGTAVLFITHDLETARRLNSRFLVMYGGKIVEEAPAEKLFAAPAHPYTAGLIGAIPGREKRGKPLTQIPGKMPSVEDRLPGCPFAPRCPKAEKRCRAVFPPLTELEKGNKVFCYNPGAGNG